MTRHLLRAQRRRNRRPLLFDGAIGCPGHRNRRTRCPMPEPTRPIPAAAIRPFQGWEWAG